MASIKPACIDGPTRGTGLAAPYHARRGTGKLVDTIGTAGILVAVMAGGGPQKETSRNADLDREPASIPQTRRAEDIRLDRDLEKSQLDVMLDSVLINERVPQGVPFELRHGQVDDPRVLDLMRTIDNRLGGRVEWPNVYTTDLNKNNDTAIYTYNGVYKYWPEDAGQTVPQVENEGIPPEERLGIHLDSQQVDRELGVGPQNSQKMRQTLVHELQHATSQDNARALTGAAVQANRPYDEPGIATAEGRADLAKLLMVELDQRKVAGGPKLNELSTTDRREVVREILSQFVTPDRTVPREEANAQLEKALRSDQYHWDPENKSFEALQNLYTDRYVTGEVIWNAPERAFIPIGAIDAGTSRARYDEIHTPLDQLAAQLQKKEPARAADRNESRKTAASARPNPQVETAKTPSRNHGTTTDRDDLRKSARSAAAEVAAAMLRDARSTKKAEGDPQGRRSAKPPRIMDRLRAAWNTVRGQPTAPRPDPPGAGSRTRTTATAREPAIVPSTPRAAPVIPPPRPRPLAAYARSVRNTQGPAHAKHR